MWYETKLMFKLPVCFLTIHIKCYFELNFFFFQLNETLVNDILEDVGVCQIPSLNGTGINPTTNLTLIQAQFRDVICDQNQVSQIFNFTSDAARDLVSNQLCNLTNPESVNNVVLLLGALQRDFNSTSLIDQVKDLKHL